MKISELSVDYVSFDDDDKEISAIAISYKDNSGKEQRRWLEKPRRIGRWTAHDGGIVEYQECSICHKAISNSIFPYCPHCGAKMDEREDNDNA